MPVYPLSLLYFVVRVCVSILLYNIFTCFSFITIHMLSKPNLNLKKNWLVKVMFFQSKCPNKTDS